MLAINHLRVSGRRLYANDRVIATLNAACHWQYRDREYVRLDVAGPLVVRLIPLNGAHQQVLAHERISFAYGCLHSPAVQLAAVHDGSNVWRNTIGNIYYSEILVAPDRTL